MGRTRAGGGLEYRGKDSVFLWVAKKRLAQKRPTDDRKTRTGRRVDGVFDWVPMERQVSKRKGKRPPLLAYSR